LSPHSPGADQIETLATIGLVAAVIVVLAVNGALFYALRRAGRDRAEVPRARETGRDPQTRMAVVLTVFAAMLFVLGLVFTDNARQTPESGPSGLQVKHSEPLRIEATGQQWLWRYEYPNQSFSYYKLVVPVDTTVDLDLVSTDVVHTWSVPDLAGKRDAVPGKHNQVVFKADEEGVYEGRSATLSGQAYAPMRTEVEVVSPERYEEFVKAQRRDIQAAQDRVVGLIESGKTP
jgi:cytochrome c oxidase subunit 2